MAKKHIPAADEAAPDNLDSEPSFEQALRDLEGIVAQLEQGDLTLEQAMALHARGQELAALCSARLEQAELKVRQVDTGGAR
jgi:exodeoxyribonuclease VII small subunit